VPILLQKPFDSAFALRSSSSFKSSELSLLCFGSLAFFFSIGRDFCLCREAHAQVRGLHREGQRDAAGRSTPQVSPPAAFGRAGDNGGETRANLLKDLRSDWPQVP
jgi:hypothetical protein